MNRTTDAAHGAGNSRTYLHIWGWLLLLTVGEVILAYRHFHLIVMLALLMCISFVKAGFIMGYFMHLKFERMSLVLTVVPVTIAVISLLFVFFPDSHRLLELRVP